MSRLRLRSLFCGLLLVLGGFSCLSSSINFINRGSTLALVNSGSKILYESGAAFTGWLQQSLVKNSGGEDLTVSDVNSDEIITYAESPNDLIAHFKTVGGGVLTVIGTTGIVGQTTLLGRAMLSSPINLSGATLNIGGDCMFSSGTTIASSGFFNPQGNAFILGGDLTIPTNMTITFTSSGILDGQGHGLFFDENARIKLDPYVTVTFRNITLHNLRDISSPENSSICMSPWRTQLVLQNANMNLDRNYSFTVGELYIHSDVTMSGTNQFNYTSSHAMLIAPDSVWNFDIGTTFSYGPVYSSARNLVRMSDPTSILFLNGTTLKSTTTGLQLSKGTLVVDHKVKLYNQAFSGAPAVALSEAISFGDGTNDLSIEILPAGSIELMTGLLVYENTN